MDCGTTGEKCKKGGIYYCTKHKTNEIPIAPTNVFPPCSRDGGHAATWCLKIADK